MPSSEADDAADEARASSPSLTTARQIWRRDAPSVRSSANSRMRWATVIEKVLKIRKAPTNSAMKANASSAVFRKPRLSRMSLDCLVGLLAAGAHVDACAAERARAAAS